MASKLVLTKVRFAYSPMNHRELEGSSHEKENGQETINAQVFLTGPTIEKTAQTTRRHSRFTIQVSLNIADDLRHGLLST